MYPIYRIAYGKNTAELLKYKDQFPGLTEEEYEKYYSLAADAAVNKRPTDLDKAGIQFLVQSAGKLGESVLDAGCGRGYAAKVLAKEGFVVTGLDMGTPKAYSPEDGYTFVCGSVDNMPFENNAFDTVISTHVLEHVPNVERTVSELLRVAKKRLILILPRQREYRYCADLHVRFFPYAYNVRLLLPSPMRTIPVQRVGHDWAVLIEKELEEWKRTKS